MKIALYKTADGNDIVLPGDDTYYGSRRVSEYMEVEFVLLPRDIAKEQAAIDAQAETLRKELDKLAAQRAALT